MFLDVLPRTDGGEIPLGSRARGWPGQLGIIKKSLERRFRSNRADFRLAESAGNRCRANRLFHEVQWARLASAEPGGTTPEEGGSLVVRRDRALNPIAPRSKTMLHEHAAELDSAIHS